MDVPLCILCSSAEVGMTEQHGPAAVERTAGTASGALDGQPLPRRRLVMAGLGADQTVSPCEAQSSRGAQRRAGTRWVFSHCSGHPLCPAG